VLQLKHLQVFGNIVGGKKIAGLVFITQESFQSLQGFITSINTTTGHFIVDNAVDCVLNDVRLLCDLGSSISLIILFTAGGPLWDSIYPLSAVDG
jgi:hypothetical protein